MAKDRGPRLALGARRFARQRLAGVLQNGRLWIKRIDMAGPAISKDVNHMLGLGCEMRQARRQRVHIMGGPFRQSFTTKQLMQGQRPKTHARSSEQFAARNSIIDTVRWQHNRVLRWVAVRYQKQVGSSLLYANPLTNSSMAIRLHVKHSRRSPAK